MWFKDCEREEIAHAWVGRQCSNMDDGCCRKRMMSGALSCAGRRERRIVEAWQDKAVPWALNVRYVRPLTIVYLSMHMPRRIDHMAAPLVSKAIVVERCRGKLGTSTLPCRCILVICSQRVKRDSSSNLMRRSLCFDRSSNE
jgi:hypothetical protein